MKDASPLGTTLTGSDPIINEPAVFLIMTNDIRAQLVTGKSEELHRGRVYVGVPTLTQNLSMMKSDL